MVGRPYVPDAGDLVWLTFDPQAGHEQGGRRPALILSPREYNAKARLALACPITNQSEEGVSVRGGDPSGPKYRWRCARRSRQEPGLASSQGGI